MTDAITVLGNIAATCELEAERPGLTYSERTDLLRRAVAYRSQQMDILGARMDQAHQIARAIIQEMTR